MSATEFPSVMETNASAESTVTNAGDTPKNINTRIRIATAAAFDAVAINAVTVVDGDS